MRKHLQALLRYPLLALAFFVCTAGNAQEITVKGAVTAADSGNPLKGVSIQEKGSANRTLTNEEGTYEWGERVIQSPADWETLQPLNPNAGLLGEVVEAAT